MTLPENYQSACSIERLLVVLAALRRGVSAEPVAEVLADDEGLAEVRIPDRSGTFQVLVEDPVTGDRGVLLGELGNDERIVVARGLAPRLSLRTPSTATATAFDEERLALVDVPISSSGMLMLGSLRLGTVFIVNLAYAPSASRVWPGADLTVDLVPLQSQVRVELAPRFASARVELSDGCRRWEQQAVGGFVHADKLPSRGYLTAALVERGEVLDSVATGQLLRGQVTQLRLGFDAAASVRLNVVDSEGAPLAARAFVHMVVPSTISGQSGFDRELPPLNVGPVPIGEATLELDAEGYARHQQMIQLEEGLNEISVRLERHQKRELVTGRVLHHSGRDVAGSGTTFPIRDQVVSVDLVVDPLDGQTSGEALQVMKGGEVSGSLDRGRWRLRGWGSDGSVLRPVEIMVPGPPIELHLIPPPPEPVE